MCQLQGVRIAILSPHQYGTFRMYRCAAPVQDPPVLPYLQEKDRHIYNINLQVSLQPQDSTEPTVIAKSNLKHL